MANQRSQSLLWNIFDFRLLWERCEEGRQTRPVSPCDMVIGDRKQLAREGTQGIAAGLFRLKVATDDSGICVSGIAPSTGDGWIGGYRDCPETSFHFLVEASQSIVQL